MFRTSSVLLSLLSLIVTGTDPVTTIPIGSDGIMKREDNENEKGDYPSTNIYPLLKTNHQDVLVSQPHMLLLTLLVYKTLWVQQY